MQPSDFVDCSFFFRYIFWTCEGRIEKAQADGSERDPMFVIDDVIEPSALTIDTDGIL